MGYGPVAIMFVRRQGRKWAFGLVVGACIGLACSEKLPVIFIPGLAGSVLEARLERKQSDVPHWYCRTSASWSYQWLQLRRMVPSSDCFVNEMEVLYQPNETKHYANHPGVFIRPYDFGGLEGVRVLDPLLPLVTTYMGTLINGFESAGYQEGRHLFGAPYDFRLAPDGLAEAGWYGDFKRLVELASSLNEGRRCVLVCHSAGCLVAHYFLRAVAEQQWRGRYIARVISLGAPWEGSAVLVKGSISGDNFGLPFPSGAFRHVQSTVPAGPWLFPTAEAWGNKTIIATKGGANYTVADLEGMLQELQLVQQAALLPLVSKLARDLPPLDIRLYCLFGYGVRTPLSYLYHVKQFGPQAPPDPDVLQHGDGDGVVPFQSLTACSRYFGRSLPLPLPGAHHQDILHSTRYINMVVVLAGFNDTVAPSPTPAPSAQQQQQPELTSGGDGVRPEASSDRGQQDRYRDGGGDKTVAGVAGDGPHGMSQVIVEESATGGGVGGSGSSRHAAISVAERRRAEQGAAEALLEADMDEDYRVRQVLRDVLAGNSELDYASRLVVS